jgi:hypothetical protein
MLSGGDKFHFRSIRLQIHPALRIGEALHQGSDTIPIQNKLRLPTSTSYLRTKSSFPSLRTRKTAKLAGTALTPSLPRTESCDFE